MSPSPIALGRGVEWIVDAHGCSPELLRSERALGGLFSRLVRELELHPLGESHFHVFPEPGGITGLLMLTESHLACHTFPETGYCAINLFCCRPRPEWPWAQRLSEMLGASRVEARKLARPGPEDGPR
ncbi:MAG: S-adenosylmethionine decarboxylase [Myxococcales bacterium]|jgi:S-adenosylmethionine decarboxylase